MNTFVVVVVFHLLANLIGAASENDIRPRRRLRRSVVNNNDIQVVNEHHHHHHHGSLGRFLATTEYKTCGARPDACAVNGGKCAKTGSTEGLIEVWEGNPNCQDMGFDFGWKSPDPGCSDQTLQTLYGDGSYLESTTLSDTCDKKTCDTKTNHIGNYTLDCKTPEGNQFKYADITSTKAVHVFVKGGTLGGALYYLKNPGELYTDLQTPSGQAISHIEFCFLCSSGSTTTAPKTPTAPVTTAPITKTPSTSSPVPDDAPVTTAPVTKAPSTSAPVTDAPVTKAPSTVAPVTDAPVTLAPVTEGPTTEAPTSCDTCKEDPIMESIPEDITVCPKKYGSPDPSSVKVTDVCGNDLFESVSVNQTLNFNTGLSVEDGCVGTVTNTWSVKPPACTSEMMEPVKGTQTITVDDTTAPAFADTVLPDLVYSCPMDYNESKPLTPPFASDNCDDDVLVVSNDPELDGCDGTDVTWTAVDDCGNKATITQTIKIDDSLPPLLKSKAPSDLLLGCEDPFPDAKPLIFTDNCAGDISVNSSDENTGGSYCYGNITERTWSGPSDVCGNQGTDVVQRFTVLDQSPPKLPTDLPVVNMTCPSTFDVAAMQVPNATDDCSKKDAITVDPTVPYQKGCDDVTVIWKATDECGNTFTSHQTVQFTDSTPPEPLNGTVPQDMTLKCTDDMPVASSLTFVDNCLDPTDIAAIEEDGGGSVCEGKKTVRKWLGPEDECGNSPDEIRQVITVVDEQAPVLPDSLDDVSFVCPSDYDIDKLRAPVATDDCDENVSVTSVTEKPGSNECSNITVVWTARDVCGNKTSANQTVYFTDSEAPTLYSSAPADVTLQCKDPIPELEQLIFNENCGEDIVVDGVQVNASGSVCDGRKLVRTWDGPTDSCGNMAEGISQIITIVDQSPPELPLAMPSIKKVCPQDFILSELDKPVATDDCTENLTITATASEQKECQDVTVTWTAVDDCGKTSTIKQMVEFQDSEPPKVIGAEPEDSTVSCGHFPAEKKLTFWDYCTGDIEVFSTDSLPTGTVCEGQVFTRSWVGPTDGCGNKAADISQTITVVDLGPPDLPEAMDEIVLSCPRDFSEHSLVAPNATDDCDTSVIVEKTVPAFDKCKDEFEVVWTAIDDCSKTDSVAQKVRFTGGAMPNITCPEQTSFTGSGGSFVHNVSYGDCFSADDITITYEPTCTDCDGKTCSLEKSTSGTKFAFSGAPAWSTVEWIAKLDYGCGVVTAQCSATQVRNSETMFGEPNGEDETKKLISAVDDGAKRWGWYKEFTFEGGAKNFSFTMHAGAGQSDLDKGFVAGTVVVTAADCATASPKSIADWTGIGDTGLCIDEPKDGHHLHVGLDLPRSKKGDISFGPGQFTPGCCNKNSTCFIAVHGVVDEARCGSSGCT